MIDEPNGGGGGADKGGAAAAAESRTIAHTPAVTHGNGGDGKETYQGVIAAWHKVRMQCNSLVRKRSPCAAVVHSDRGRAAIAATEIVALSHDARGAVLPVAARRRGARAAAGQRRAAGRGRGRALHACARALRGRRGERGRDGGRWSSRTDDARRIRSACRVATTRRTGIVSAALEFDAELRRDGVSHKEWTSQPLSVTVAMEFDAELRSGPGGAADPCSARHAADSFYNLGALIHQVG